MTGVADRLGAWLSTRSVFSLLLITTGISTLALTTVAVATLQRVADEHPRRYLARALFEHVAEIMITHPQTPMVIDGERLQMMSGAEARARGYGELLDAALADRDGVAVRASGDRYAAGLARGDTFVLLPRFGAPISTAALGLVALLALATLVVLALIYAAMRRLTRPFGSLEEVVASIEAGDLSQRAAPDAMFGEFRRLALGVNHMLDHIARIHESRRQMLLAIPHELFGPLSRLRVRKDMIDDATLRDRIADDIGAVESLLNAIMATERRESGELRKRLFDLDAFVAEALEPFVHAGASISVVNETGAERVRADTFSLGVLLKNFVGNAVRYGGGTPISVRLSRTACGALALEVCDQGPGVEESQIPFMTEPFWRADEARIQGSGGHGIGLYLCRVLAANHGGRIEIDSKPGEGLSIRAILPDAFPDSMMLEDT